MSQTDERPAAVWPDDMAIAEERRDDRLLPLVWAHAVWSVREPLPGGTVRCSPSSSSGAPLEPDALDREWASAWTAAMESLARQPDPGRVDEDGAIDRMLAWQRDAPAAWDDRFAEHWDAPAYDDWLERVAPGHGLDVEWPDEVVPALVVAWRAGLRSIVVVPTEEPFAQRFRPDGLLVSWRTRTDVAAVDAALASFR